MRAKAERLRIVILEYPYDTLRNPDVQPLFSKTMALRLRGYGQEHKEGVLPVDTYDFIGTHQLICQEGQERRELEPIFCFRTVTMSRCSYHHLPFPAVALLRDANASPSHHQALSKILNDCHGSNEGIAYHSSWTIDPDIRQDRDMTHLLKEMLMALLVYSRSSFDISQSIVCGVPRFRTDIFCERMGYAPLQDGEKRLGTIQQANLFDEPVVMMFRKEPSFEARRAAAKFEEVWRNRMHIQAPDRKKKAA